MANSQNGPTLEIERRSIAMLPSGAWAVKRERALEMFAEIQQLRNDIEHLATERTNEF